MGKSEDIRKTLLKTLMTIKGHKRFKAGIPELDPVGEMNIKSDELTVALAEVAELDQKISESSLKGNAKLNAYVNAFERKIKLQSKVQDLEKQVSASQFMVMTDDLRAMKRVLRRLEFIDKEGVVQLKGRMACELTSADEVLLTEIVFQNVFDGMEANNIIALCYCLVFDERSEDPMTNNPELVKAFDQVKGIARGVGDIVVAWLEGKRFFEIMNQCNLYEGSVVRVIRRLEELVRELATAAKTIGNQELEKKLNEGRGRLKR